MRSWRAEEETAEKTGVEECAMMIGEKRRVQGISSGMLQAEVGADMIGQVDDGEEAQEAKGENDKGRSDRVERAVVGGIFRGLQRMARGTGGGGGRGSRWWTEAPEGVACAHT